ncbi:Probable TonB-dependent outer membrane hemin receptor precursor PhuR [Flavobacterium indicum GPTSA100-9 = DSM 17447]|uniref:Probable TonB-dependent outer membrane hemin receptor PhuR n=1 Tax=Flavobacterium indicum (strain DSM 17447 / CIP 109464 / GPTSA100-9) TaxID=1094466 RepID=H8XRF6_FLAIG|nr:TonB-dependent receptor [Flavobacterium indicum]CCG54390.1 Probable TonB-dependent outer membrane hemin receptor precursor PhuR [Flavobacterium indicum GPTSA100-9 = DSM 17447]
MKKYILLIILMGYTFMGFSQNSIQGVVKSKENEKISSAKISVSESNITSLSDENGAFELKNLPIGKLTLIIEKEGFELKSETVQIRTNETKTIEIILEDHNHHIDEVIVSTVFNKTQKENVMKVDHLVLKNIQNQGVVNLSEAIATNPGVTQLSTGNSIGKPIIRGLSGNRVLTYAQGIRLENQQFGEEHGLGLNGNGVESVEIIKGPASLLYGSDAMGGVLYFNPEKYAATGKTNLELNQVFHSNTQGSNTSFGVKSSTEKFKFLWQNNYTTHADYTTPDGETVVNTRFLEKDIKLGAAYETSHYTADLRYNFNALNLGLPEEDIVDEYFRTPLFPSQKIDNHLLSLSQKVFFGKSKLESTIGYVFNNRKELESVDEVALYMKLKTFNYNVRYYLPTIGKFETIIGIQGLNQKNANFGEERLIPNATLNDVGAFATTQISLNKNTFQLGIRYDHRKVDAETFGTEGEEGFFPTVNRKFESFNTALGVKTKWTDQLISRLNVATGFRAPNLSELTSNGVHEGSNRYEIGNASLKNEQNVQVDLNLDYTKDHFDFFVNGFYNHITNYIFIQPTGEEIDGNVVYNYVQNNAALFGGEAGVHLHPHPLDWLHITSSYEMVFGKQKDNSDLPLIPANVWKNNLKANFDLNSTFKNAYFYIQANYTLAQNNISVFETATNDYLLLGSGLGTDVVLNKVNFKVFLSGTNLLNKEYFAHLSRLKSDGIYNMGRNIVLGLNFNL